MATNVRRVLPVMLLGAVLVGVLLWVGCSQVDLMGPDSLPPSGTSITDPADGVSVNSQFINVRGFAEVGATVQILVNGIPAGTAVSSPAVPPMSGLGRFTVKNVDLGEEGMKVLAARTTDLYGNTADGLIESLVRLDLTAPPVGFRRVRNANWIPDSKLWESGNPLVVFAGTTDTTASAMRVRFGINEFLPDSVGVDPAQQGGGRGPGPVVLFRVPVGAPPLTAANPDSEVTYYVEAMDDADNVSSYPVTVYWKATGADTVLRHDDGSYGSTGNSITGQAEMAACVMFQAPVWANYVTEIHYFVMNDNQTNTQDPQLPTTKPFTAYVWRPNQVLRPGLKGNEGKNSGELYPEEEWLQLALDQPVDITKDSWYPNKQFFVGIEWENKNNPIIGVDTDEPIDQFSFRWNWEEWVWSTTADYMIRAVVSDIPGAGTRGRTATLTSFSK